ncbi:MAG: type II toxin-antitoxin system RelE/ParE family toxin [Candidatus Komeilibacteria bacterium]|nr:type II toxin-antitoxin system RelE/ParE family toxin [Candidatus Komeilibacteria bacterium]
MSFAISYHTDVVAHDIPKLSESDRKRIKQAIETKLTENPEIFGKPLRRSLKGYRKLRVGDYRVIFRIEGTSVKIFVIQHRSIIYKKTDQRLST